MKLAKTQINANDNHIQYFARPNSVTSNALKDKGTNSKEKHTNNHT